MRRFFCSILFLLISVASLSGYSQSNQKSFGIAYFEPGSYYLFDVFSNELTDNLEEMGGDSMNIAYLPDARFSANWDRNLCKAMANDLVKAKNVDLVIAAGPWVIEDLLAAGFKKPIVGICQFDPESMGLIDSTGKTLFSNVTVNYSPRKIKSDIAALKKLFPSRKIGMLYFPSGKEFDRVKGKISKAAGDTGTAVVSAQIYTRQDLYSFSFSFEKIKKEARVLYLAPLWGMDLNAIREFFIETQKARIPTFDAEGFLLLEKGATAANCYRPYHSMVKFTALKVMKIIGGTEPSSLHTRFEEFPELCLNLDAAQKIGLTFPRKMINDAKLIPVPPSDTVSVYTLAQALDQAAKENSGYLAMGQTYERAVAEARKGYLSYYPQVDIGISSATTNDGALASRYEKLLNRKFQADINVEQILFSYPVLKSIHIAKKNMTMKRVNLKQAALDLKQAVTGAYITVLEKEDKVAAQNGMIDWLRDLRDYVETNSRLSLGGKNDLPFIELQLAQAKISLYNLQNEIKVSR
ncbi:MAG: TolC family protein, partial [candidate division Zixibacteria bacterium]|nr:TolC family protein [candidate division Zixibacteria bacterium]